MQKAKFKNKHNQGFTLIELILYVGIVSIVVTAAVTFAWNIIYSRVRSQIQVEVNQNMKLVANRIAYEIRTASDIATVSASTLSLENDDLARNPTEVSIASNKIMIGYGSAGDCPTTNPCELTSNNIVANSLTFTDLSSTNAKNVKFSFELSYLNLDNLNEYDSSAQYTTSVTVRSN